MTGLIDLLLAGLTVLLRDTGQAEDAVKFLSAGLAGWRGIKTVNAETHAATSMLLSMREAGGPTRAQKDAEFARIMAAITSVKPS